MRTKPGSHIKYLLLDAEHYTLPIYWQYTTRTLRGVRLLLEFGASALAAFDRSHRAPTNSRFCAKLCRSNSGYLASTAYRAARAFSMAERCLYLRMVQVRGTISPLIVR